MSTISASELIQQLDLYKNAPRTDLKGTLAFKESKRALKAMAKKEEELSETERGSILKILQGKGFFKNTHGYCSTEVLFTYPKFWKILHHPLDFPEESKALASLPSCLFRDFITFVMPGHHPSCSIHELITLTQTATLLDIPSFERTFRAALTNNAALTNGSLSVDSFYFLSTLLPAANVQAPSELKELLPEHPVREEIAKEYARFKRMIDGSFAEEKANLDPEQLYRFFLFLGQSYHSTPLGQEVFDLLLTQLISGKLDVKYAQGLISIGQNSGSLHERLKQDKLIIVLGAGAETSVCLWPLFMKSDFVQRFLRSGMKEERKIKLEGNKASVFFLFYDLWIKGKEIDLDALSVDQLIGLLECIAFFQPQDFAETKSKIVNALLNNSDNSAESIAALAELDSVIPCRELVGRIVSWLINLPFLSIEGNQITVDLQSRPSFTDLEGGIRVLKAFKDRFSLKGVVAAKDFHLQLLCALYVCNQLEFQGKEVFEQLSLNETAFTDSESWSSHDVVYILRELGDPSFTHIQKGPESLYYCSDFWRKVYDLIKDRTIISLREEAAAIPALVENPHGLSAQQLPSFLHYVMRNEADVNLSEAIGKMIVEKQIDFAQLKNSVEDCLQFFPEKAEWLNRLRIPVQVGDGTVMIPLPLFVKLQQGREICSEGKMVSTYPSRALQWAVDFIETALLKKSLPPMEAQDLTPGHFQALTMLQKDVFRSTEYPFQKQTKEICHLVDAFPKETLPAAAAWAAPNECHRFLDRCLESYCGSESLKSVYVCTSLQLTSLTEKPLKMLEVIGQEVRSLTIGFEPHADVVENPWEKIVNSCPKLVALALYLEGVPKLETFPFDRLSNLTSLLIHLQDATSWNSLCQLKIPPSLQSFKLSGEIESIIEANAYELFRNLPAKGVILDLDFESAKKIESSGILSGLWNMWGSDPIQAIFSNLNHCTDLSLGTISTSGLSYVTKNIPHLKSLKVVYENNYPTIEEIQTLLARSTDLQTCGFEITLFDEKPAEEELGSYLEALKNLKNCNLKINLGGAYDKKLDNQIPERSQQDGLPMISFTFNSYLL